MSKFNSDEPLQELSESCADSRSREQAVGKLRPAAERFYDQASLEQVLEMELFIRTLLAGRGLLPEQGQRASSETPTNARTLPQPAASA